MDNRHSLRDPSIFIPLLIGSFSLIGIVLILLSVGFPKRNPQTTSNQVATPFKYLLIATETIIPTRGPGTPAPAEFYPTPTASSEVDNSLQFPPTEGDGNPDAALPAPNGQIINSTSELFIPPATITPNPIFADSSPMTFGIYDASDSYIIRNGNWTGQGNAIAYHETLLVSNTVGSYVAFSFVGQQIVLGYQPSENAGDMLVNIDGLELAITQLVGNAWFSQELEIGTHFVVLTHKNGTTITLDYINVLQ